MQVSGSVFGAFEVVVMVGKLVAITGISFIVLN